MRLFGLIILLGLALAGCDTGEKLPALPSVPLASFTGTTGKVAVAPLTSELVSDKAIGGYSRNVDCFVFVRALLPRDLPGFSQLNGEVLQVLQQAKLNVQPVNSTDPAAAEAADYLLVGTVPQTHVDMCLDNFFLEGPTDVDAQVTIAWKLLSVKDKRVVYQTNTTGSARASDPNERVDAGVIAAVGEATKQLLQTASVQQYLTFGRVIPPPDAVASAGGIVPPGGQAPIPAPPGSIRRPSAELAALLVPVVAARGDTAALDAGTARAATVPVAQIGGTQGVGVVIGQGYVLTTASLLGDAVSVVVTPQPGQSVEGRLVRKDADADIALLKVDEALPPPLPLQPRRLAVGDKIYGVGRKGVVPGTIASTRASGGSDRVSIDGAETGGPVLDANGNVMGLLQADGNYLSIGRAFRVLNLGTQPADE